jgi:DNA polymerase-3 subunit beta
MPLSDYPRLPQIPPTVGTITADDFRTLVNKVAFSAANREEANPIFTGARLDISGPELSLVATDKVRLALYSAKWDSPGVESAAPVVVKARVLQDVARSLVAESSDVEIGLAVDGGINVISFTNGPRVTTSQLIDGGYPNVLGLFADSYPIQVSVAREALISALKRVALVSEREVLLKFRQGEVELVAGQGEEANASEMLPSTLNGEDITIALRPSFLLDGLGALTKDFASLNLTHPIKPVEVRGRDSVAGEDDESFRYLFVPIRIAG